MTQDTARDPALLRKLAPYLFAALVGVFYVLNAVVMNWVLADGGTSPVTGTTPFWDFNNLWSGTRMALDGNVDTLWDAEAYRAELRGMHSPDLPDHEWSYPPHMLLVGLPFALLPELSAYLLWTSATLFAAFLAIRAAGATVLETAAAMVSSTVGFNILLGQNGALTAALFLGGFALLEKRPALAGVLFGLLTVKPHLGIVIPLVLIVTHSWTTIATACLTSAAMLAGTTMIWGGGVWTGFMEGTVPLMRDTILYAPVPQGFQINSANLFMTMRSLGMGIAPSQLIQLALSASCALAAAWAWSRRDTIDRPLLIAITATLAFAALPYGYVYEMLGVMFAAVILLRYQWTPWGLRLFALVSATPVISRVLFQHTYTSTAILVVGLLLWALWAAGFKRTAPVTTQTYSTDN